MSFVSWIVSAVLFVAAPAQQELGLSEGLLPAPSEAGATEERSVWFEGFVSTPEGLAAEGAVVVTSAGGQAVADAEGYYRLEAKVAWHLGVARRGGEAEGGEAHHVEVVGLQLRQLAARAALL